jgi:hypothetical protein
MRLRSGGIDIFYIDESNDSHIYVVTAATVPFLRETAGIWNIVWPDYLDAAKEWRRRVRDALDIPVSKELHGVKLASGRGRYLRGKYSFDRPKAGAAYREILRLADFLPDASIITVRAQRGGRALYGATRLEAALHALFQRMRSQCEARRTNGFVFFDEGHEEYRKLYRRAQRYLPTGSSIPGAGWGEGQTTRNIPLDMFTKDANNKISKHCHFTQLADLVAYAAFLKMKYEINGLAEWQARYSLGNVYDALPALKVNRRATPRYPDGIVRLA